MSDRLFESMSQSSNDGWWNIKSRSIEPLHVLNALRLEYVNTFLRISSDIKFLDYGCGGGILCEPLARLGADVTGFDQNQSCVLCASEHALQNDLQINYTSNIEQIINNKYDAVSCFEVLEHSETYQEILKHISQMLNNNGLFFVSTLNKTIKSLIGAKFIAEYVLGIVQKGMHDHNLFIKPQDLIKSCSQYGLDVVDISGVSYNPLTKKAKLCTDLSVNYIAVFRKLDK
jgi:2-polyprenyl-6-hydroxyphenyl methylase/3-demethylubiquinone-9 3-methyltransferase